DVVTEGDPGLWTYPPFGADLVDGRIYGRGAADMKSGLAAAMVTAAVFKRSGTTLGGRLVVGALVDVEGDMIGVRHLCETALGRAPLSGPPQANVIPGAAEATLDIRLTPGPAEDVIAAELDAACRRAAAACAGVSIEWRSVNGYRLATSVDKDEALVKAMTQ